MKGLAYNLAPTKAWTDYHEREGPEQRPERDRGCMSVTGCTIVRKRETAIELTTIFQPNDGQTSLN